MKAYSTKQHLSWREYYIRPEKKYYTYTNYPQHFVMEKIYYPRDGNADNELHRYYIDNKYIGEIFGESSYVRISMDKIHICDMEGNSALIYIIK